VNLLFVFSGLTLQRRYLIEEISVWLSFMNLGTWIDIFNM
jgi:hypothetical protein